ncbi:MAG TPA: hypothetical protein VGB45_06995 [Abditibacterium sp.]|jgi:hypothetical protein
MNAPLPNVPPAPAKKRDFDKAPFRGLSAVCALQVASLLLYLVIHTPDAELSRFWDWAIEGFGAGVGILLTFYLWRGYGWARAVLLWLIVVSLPIYVFPDLLGEAPPKSRAETILNGFDFVFSLFLLVYLNLPVVKAHFARRETVE